MMIYDEEVYVSEEQQRDYNLLVKLSDSINTEISKNRNAAIEILLSEDLLASNKKAGLKSFVRSRIDFEHQIITLDSGEYTYNQLILLAQKLFDDKTFFGNDSAYVMNGLAFYENSISFEDVILAFHNYRLGHEDEDLWWLSLLLCRYIYTILSMDSIYKRVSFGITESYEELKKLSQYVVDFWERYLKDTIVETFSLTDDKKRDFYDKIDSDAEHYFSSEDAASEVERKQIDAEYAAELVRQCSKSLYLLKSTIEEIDCPELSKQLKTLRKAVYGICEDLYFGDEDAYRELEKDNRINSAGITSIEKENEIKLLKSILQTALDKLKGCNTETTLINRQDALRTVSLVESEELIEEFVKKFSDQLMQSIPRSLDAYYERLKVEIGSKYNLLPREALNALASAEYLYDMFVRKKAPKDFDFSGIAVLYFQAFETAYDMLLIEPYSNWLKQQKVDELYVERRRIKKKINKHRTQKEKDRLNEIETKLLNQYFSKAFNIDYFYSKGALVTCLEIGKFQRFIDLGDCLSTNSNGQADQLIVYLETQCFGKKIDPVLIKNFAKSVNNAIIPRNKAAHGLNGLREVDVIEDKVIVYDETNIKDILNFKNLLFEFLEFYN